MNIRWNVILSIIAFGLLGWFYSLNRDAPDLSNLVKKPDSPDYIGNKMETTVFSPEGKKQYVSLADNVKHYTVDGHTDFEMPLVYLFDVNSSNTSQAKDVAHALASQSWKLSAKKVR